jgi:Protein of unknown function (DUF3105)
MPPKPRPHGKKPRAQVPGGSSRGPDRRTLIALGIGGAVAIAAVAAALAFTLGGGDNTDASAALEEAGCTVTTATAQPGNHSVAKPEGTSKKWNTTPPTTGPHYAVPAVWGTYDEPVNQAQLVHNLEHGGIAVQYGEDVPAATVQQLKAFAQDHPRGTVLAPYPALGSQIALGAWVTASADEPKNGTGYLAKCPSFDEAAFEAFFDAYQFQGPERFPPDTLLPGRT